MFEPAQLVALNALLLRLITTCTDKERALQMLHLVSCMPMQCWAPNEAALFTALDAALAVPSPWGAARGYIIGLTLLQRLLRERLPTLKEHAERWIHHVLHLACHGVDSSEARHLTSRVREAARAVLAESPLFSGGLDGDRTAAVCLQLHALDVPATLKRAIAISARRLDPEDTAPSATPCEAVALWKLLLRFMGSFKGRVIAQGMLHAITPALEAPRSDAMAADALRAYAACLSLLARDGLLVRRCDRLLLQPICHFYNQTFKAMTSATVRGVWAGGRVQELRVAARERFADEAAAFRARKRLRHCGMTRSRRWRSRRGPHLPA